MCVWGGGGGVYIVLFSRCLYVHDALLSVGDGVSKKHLTF